MNKKLEIYLRIRLVFVKRKKKSRREEKWFMGLISATKKIISDYIFLFRLLIQNQ